MNITSIQSSYKGPNVNPQELLPKHRATQIINRTPLKVEDGVISTQTLSNELTDNGLHAFDFFSDSPSTREPTTDSLFEDFSTATSVADDLSTTDNSGGPPDDKIPELLEFSDNGVPKSKNKNLLWASTVSFFASILLAFGVHSKEEICGMYTKFLRLPSALATITLGAVTLSEWLRASPQNTDSNPLTPQNNKFEEVTFAPN